MTTSTLASFSMLMLLSTAALAPAQTEATPRPSAQPAGSPSTTSATFRPGATTAPSADYRIVPGDKLKIDVYKDAQLSQALQVRPDGKITLPLIGDVAAEGRTSSELRDALVTSLKEYNTNPVVTVIVVETVPPVFYVMGEVNGPGSLPLKGEVTVLQALAMAGGFKDFAKTSRILIQRKGAAGISSLKFNYDDAVKGKGQTIYLKPGDTIIVP
jgi:polysaccharide biosynthesis/export protein